MTMRTAMNHETDRVLSDKREEAGYCHSYSFAINPWAETRTDATPLIEAVNALFVSYTDVHAI